MSPGPHLTITPLKDANCHSGLLDGVLSSPGESPSYRDTVPLITIIDDSLTVRRIVETLCQRLHLRVQAFPAGAPAIAAWEQADLPAPDLILMDIEMPGPNGYTLIRWCASQPALQHTPIILLSGHQDGWHKLRGKLAGATAYLPKPFQSSHLVKVLLDILARVRPDWQPLERTH